MTDFNLIPILPEIFLAISAMGLLIVGVITKNETTPVLCWAATMALSMTALILLALDWERQYILNDMFVVGQFAGFMKLTILLGLIATLAMSVRFLEQERMQRFEYPVLIMFAGLGMMLMVSANSLLSLYMGLELQSLSLYVLAAFNRNSLKSAEAGVKYFVLGALSSGMILFGISLIYGFVGSVDYLVIRDTLSGLHEISFGLTLGLVFMLAGLAFKISAAPFHMWTPDVYEGAPASVTALFAIVPKVAAMALIMRLLFVPFISMHDDWLQVVYFLSVASMALGAFAAIAQDNIKRLMAYSSIGNMGYALIAVVTGTQEGAGAATLYLFIYMIMTAGVFVIILSMRREDKPVYKISDMAGMAKTNPILAYAMAIFMFSMSGIPPMAGFFGKLFVFQAAIHSGFVVLAVLGVLTSVVAAYYYLRIIKVMFFDDSIEAMSHDVSFARRAVLLITLAFVLVFVLRPAMIVDSTRSAAAALFFG